MPRRKQADLTLGRLPKGTIFKIEEKSVSDAGTLTLEGVYQIGIAKEDHGQSVVVRNLARLRKRGETFSYEGNIRIPADAAKQIKVYRLPREPWVAATHKPFCNRAPSNSPEGKNRSVVSHDRESSPQGR